MPLSDNISIGMENFTTITFKKLNFTDQEFHMKSFLKAIEFQQEDPTTGIWYTYSHLKGWVGF